MLKVNEITCSNCQRPYPELAVHFRCQYCGGTFDYTSRTEYDPKSLEIELPGIWRYRHMFGLTPETSIISLGEGNTPLVWGVIDGQKIFFKLEYLNPTGSFKDRASSVLISFLRSRGIHEAVEDSSGNAGASFAAYAARAGLKGRVFVPESASGPKRAQIVAYGAEIIAVPGPRSKAAEAVLQQVKNGKVYASHAYLPFGLQGYATIAYELVEQLSRAPGTLLAPVGHGSLLLGIGRGFVSLRNAGVIDQLPRLVGVQTRACAPIWALSTFGPSGLVQVEEGETVAEGIRVRYPVRGEALVRMVEASQGFFLAIPEADILPGRDHLAQQGFYVEPTSAVVWQAVKELAGTMPEPIVAVLTGAGLKYFSQ